MRACRSEPNFLAVVTECAFERSSIFFVALNHSERACDHAIGAAVADIRLHIDAAKLGSNDRSSGTGFKTSSVFTMFADVGRKAPRCQFGTVAAAPDLRRMFHEFHVSPSRVSDGASVVVGEPGPIEPIIADAVPLLARDLARLAADAQRRVGEKCRGRAHAASLIFALSSSRAARPRGRLPGRRSQTSALVSIMRTLGSSLIATRSLAASPRASPRRPQW